MTPLTAIEMGVLLSLAEGLSQGEIAAERLVGLETVRSHTQALRLKLGARNSAHAVALAYHRGLLIPRRTA